MIYTFHGLKYRSKLLASSNSITGIRKLIAKYFYSPFYETKEFPIVYLFPNQKFCSLVLDNAFIKYVICPNKGRFQFQKLLREEIK